MGKIRAGEAKKMVTANLLGKGYLRAVNRRGPGEGIIHRPQDQKQIVWLLSLGPDPAGCISHVLARCKDFRVKIMALDFGLR